MYRVYVDDILIHDSVAQDFEIHLKSPKVTIEENAAGSFSAIIPPYNPGHDIVERMLSTIYVKRDAGPGDTRRWVTIWSGRVTTESMDAWNNRSITCEGALAYFNDTIQPIETYNDSYVRTYMTRLIESHNSRVPQNRQILIGTINALDSVGMYEYKTENNNTLQELKTHVFDRLEGHLRIRYDSQDRPVLDYLEDYPNTSSQEINFGENLLDFTKNWNLNNLVTYLYPRGKQLDVEDNAGNQVYVTIETVNNGSPYLVNTQAYQRYGRIEKVVDFNEAETPEFLKQLGQQYLAGGQFDEMSLEVSAIDLHKLSNDYPPPFELLDRVRCVSAPHGLDDFFPITKMDIQLDTTNGITYTLGNTTSTSFTSSVNAGQSSLNRTMRSLFSSTFKTLEVVKREAADMINAKVTGYVTITGDDTASQALVISETPNWENSQRFWRWNMNGLGFTKDSGETYDLALTNDGRIVANMITAGVLQDAMGYNFWNLETGAFKLSWNTELPDQSTLKDIADTADNANNKKTGSANYLNGTSDWSNWRFSGNWSKNQDHEDEMDCSKRSISSNVDVLRTPENSIRYLLVKGYIMTFSLEGVSYDDWGPIGASNCLAVSFVLVNSGGSSIGKFERAFSFDLNWSRRFCTVEMLDETFNATANTNNAHLEIWITNRSAHKITIRKIQFERGNTPTDWSISEDDTKEVAKELAEDSYNKTKDDLELAISKTEAYTREQIGKYNEMLNQEAIFKKLTNNGAAKGIFMQNNNLYVNASYIQSGSVTADIIRAGIIQDVKKHNSWNLETGYMRLNDILVESSVGGYGSRRGVAQLSSGTLRWYGSDSSSSNNLRGWIGMDLERSSTSDIRLYSKGSIFIESRAAYFVDHNQKLIFAADGRGYTGSVSFEYVSRVDGNGNASFGHVNLRYEGGLLVYASTR